MKETAKLWTASGRKMLVKQLKKADQCFLDLLYPVRCPFCDRVAADKKDPICPSCRKRITEITEPACKRCGKPLSDSRKEYCPDCERRQHWFRQGKALWVYDGKVKESLYRFKYQNKREYGKTYACEIAHRYGKWICEKGIQAVLPIPLHKKRQRMRGYNQAQVLAEELGQLLDLPVRTDLLIRVRDTKPQKTLNDKERKNNLKNAFKTQKSSVQLNCILIIDDIYTTGSTLDAAASVLKDAGVSEIYVCCVSIGRGC